MCGRYSLRRVNLVLSDLNAVPELPCEEFTELPRFNVAPSQLVPIVRLNGEGQRSAGLLRWGFIPRWAKELPKVQPINARAETVATSGMFRLRRSGDDRGHTALRAALGGRAQVVAARWAQPAA